MKLTTLYILTILTFTFFSCKDNVESVFTDKTYRNPLRQNIGGILMRETHYSDDFYSWSNDKKYTYKDKFDSLIDIGSGTYYAEKPTKDEQLIRVGKWRSYCSLHFRKRKIHPVL